ncbi:hypothetical protein Tco_1409607 [Tanacetum coccineum]
MDLETAQTNATIKLPILKQGEYEMWRLRIEQYFQVQDYALWDFIENSNSFKPTARTTSNADGTSTSMISGLVTTEEKGQKKNDVKAKKGMLMMRFVVESDPEADPEEDDDEDPEEGSYAPSAEETEPFETDESAATPPPHPEYRVTTQDFYSRLLSTARSLELNMTQHLRTRLEEDTNEIYTRLDDEQSQRQLLAGRLNMLFRDRRAHAYTHHQIETEARLSREAWRRSMDASDLTRVGVMSLRTIVLGQMSDIRELQDTDRRRQAMDLECLKADIGDLQR